MKTIVPLLFSFFIATAAQAGAWGEGSFENDAALDWVAECTSAISISPVLHALEAALKDEYIEAPQGSAAIAAAEIVAASIGKPSDKIPGELQSWLRHIPSEQLKRLAPSARKALARIQDPKASELKHLWSEGKPNRWASVVSELESRLGK